MCFSAKLPPLSSFSATHEPERVSLFLRKRVPLVYIRFASPPLHAHHTTFFKNQIPITAIGTRNAISTSSTMSNVFFSLFICYFLLAKTFPNLTLLPYTVVLSLSARSYILDCSRAVSQVALTFRTLCKSAQSPKFQYPFLTYPSSNFSTVVSRTFATRNTL